jgi:hypothetical protein
MNKDRVFIRICPKRRQSIWSEERRRGRTSPWLPCKLVTMQLFRLAIQERQVPRIAPHFKSRVHASRPR